MRNLTLPLIVLALALALAACGGGKNGEKSTATSPAGTAAQPIPTVVGNPMVTADGLHIIDVQVGSGAEVKPGDTITAQYTGYLDDGTIFDGPAFHGGPIQFSLGGVIKGWADGVPGMKVGGKRRLIVPPDLAYGESGSGPIPPNATLTFDIELVSIP